ncbi:cobyrinate a,c-diamide synthase [Treponema sp. C6A8]|uniref:cobyrinate a,c-diamide synthase n=1 Tax=Treponema sp. C6A8 TaxID=1410609 RepID=UPI0004890277|nr:cobyrinate a,c-diamide synthase [Treponema sp. C6A8]
MSCKLPRIVIAAPKSGSGKTLVTIALMGAFMARGKKLAGFKCGPDYIDPMFHKKILGIPSKNLDLFFTDEEQTRRIFADGNQAELSIIEGVMGLYDGTGGVSLEASTYHLAKTLKAPIVLVIDAKGMGLSLVAEIQGFLGMDSARLIKTVILNNIPKTFFEQIKPVIEEKCGISVSGYFPFQKDIEIESRHLGLKLPDEIEGIKEMAAKAAEKIAKTVDLDELLKIAQEAGDLPADMESSSRVLVEPRLRIAVARDEAFCFYYEDNLRLLESYGARIVDFSPLHDEKLPEDIDGLIFGGGYPEFYAEKLSQKAGIMEEIRQKITSGMPSLAECGGFMYLHKTLKNQSGNTYQMAGLIDGDTFYTGKLVRFGYITMTAAGAGGTDTAADKTSSFFNGKIKGHEFHYFDSTQNGDSFKAVKTNGKEYQLGLAGENHFWSFAHLYYPSSPDFAKNFVEKCRIYKAGKK